MVISSTGREGTFLDFHLGVPWLYSLALICPVYLLWFSSPLYLVPLSDRLPSRLSSYSSRSADSETSSYRNWVLSVLCCVCTHP